ncbi:MAG TPA: SIS domain-containing protein [Chloroflexota bacterium]|jgi:glucosamine--fructose-6-phosphate aminotransferase (isomerizing)
MASTETGGLARLRDEIGEQPAAIARVLARQGAAVWAVAREIERRAPPAAVFVARGSSDNAAVYGRYVLEVRNRLLTSLAAPSTVTLYGAGPALAGTVAVAVSQSGRGEDVRAYLAYARAAGALTVAVVNDPSSPVAAAADAVLDCLAGPELSVPATKSVTTQMTVLAMLSAALAGEGASSLAALPAAVERALAAAPRVGRLADALAPFDALAVVGRGFAYPAALEIALKLKEAARVRAEPFSAADFQHGPVTLADRSHPALVCDVGGRSAAEARAAIARVRRQGGASLRLRAPPGAVASGQLAEHLAAIPAVVLGQLLAVELGLRRGVDPASPSGLAKVTSTR